MTRTLAVDGGLNTGISLGYYDATTPYQLLQRWQVHRGLDGFLDWLERNADVLADVDEIVVEQFVYEKGADADIVGVPIEGAIALWARQHGVAVIWQNRTHKAALTGYPASATTKAQRQRVRFDWLKERGLFVAGTENDDSNDAITHSLVSLKLRRHGPTIARYWGRRKEAA